MSLNLINITWWKLHFNCNLLPFWQWNRLLAKIWNDVHYMPVFVRHFIRIVLWHFKLSRVLAVDRPLYCVNHIFIIKISKQAESEELYISPGNERHSIPILFAKVPEVTLVYTCKSFPLYAFSATTTGWTSYNNLLIICYIQFCKGNITCIFDYLSIIHNLAPWSLKKLIYLIQWLMNLHFELINFDLRILLLCSNDLDLH